MTFSRRRVRLAVPLPLLLFLSAGVAEATGVHRCPHHDVLPGAADSAAELAAAHHGTGVEPAHHSDSEAHEDCTCMGACQPAGAALTPEGEYGRAPFDSSATRAVGWSSAAAAPGRPAPFLLPFANAPPSR